MIFRMLRYSSLVLLCAALFAFSGCSGCSGAATVPNVVGMSQTAASAALTAAHLAVGDITQTYSSRPVGEVLLQDPEAGSTTAPGTQIALVVSQGPQPEGEGEGEADVTVPNVVGMAQSAASAAIIAADLIVGVVTQAYSSRPVGEVVSQVPGAGSSVAPGTAVALTVSQGPQPEGEGEGEVDVAFEMVSVPETTFMMGNTGAGDDYTYTYTYYSGEDLPAHSVTLSPYQIAKYDVTNEQYCEVLNWALAQGYLKDYNGGPWTGSSDIYGGDDRHLLLFTANDAMPSDILYSGGKFSPKTRTGQPTPTTYSTANHPVHDVSWYGAVAFCNWLNEIEGLTPCYDMTKPSWPPTAAPPTPGGYRLPTEAEWENAAAWDGTKHWTYGFTSDTLTGSNTCNYGITPYDYVNPLGLPDPCTSPVGWFNGVNVSPNGNVATANSVSPKGCYDMSGNVGQWCHDWYSATYYTTDAVTNPTGPATGTMHSVRGGGWVNVKLVCRTACRWGWAYGSAWSIGFRVARTP